MDIFWGIATNNGLLIGALATLLWGVSLAVRNASIVDPCWGLGFVVIAISTWFQVEDPDWYSSLMTSLVAIWGLRLTVYLTWRNAGKGEDRRYTAMRDKHGDRFWWVSLLTVFWLQAGLMWLVSLTPQVAIIQGGEGVMAWMVVPGMFLWSVGLFFEAVGDWQMAQFKALPENRGQVMNRGLWRYTRHPNYFGDFCVWWGFYLMGLPGGAAWTLLGPVVMSVLLLKVSGVSLLEKDIQVRRPAYAEYQARTNAFFPGPPRNV